MSPARYKRDPIACLAELLVVAGNPVDDVDQVAVQSNHLGVMKGGRAVSGFSDVPNLEWVRLI